MKELPQEVPKKRRQVETALDIHIAMWLSSDDLTSSERKRLEREKQRRKSLTPEKTVGILVGQEGITPAQEKKLFDIVEAYQTEQRVQYIYTVPQDQPKLRRKLHYSTDEATIVTIVATDLKEIVYQSTQCLAFPKESEEPVQKIAEVWAAIRHAKHRSMPVRIIMPDGNEAN